VASNGGEAAPYRSTAVRKVAATLAIGSIRPEKLGVSGDRMTRAAGRSLELFFIDGIPEGMLTAEVFNWTGHVLMAPER
jgi:hypothetical protein